MDSVCIAYDYVPLINHNEWGLIHIVPIKQEDPPIITSDNPILEPLNPIIKPDHPILRRGRVRTFR